MVKAAVSPDSPFGIGLYLSHLASEEIQIHDLRKWLKENDVYVFTMNGFPYGNFHDEVVKENVYRPDWTTSERVNYTKKLFSILAEIIPADVEGSISTVPVSYKFWFEEDSNARLRAMKIASENLAEVAFFIAELSERKQNYFHLDLEPEPDCILENTHDVILFWKEFLIPKGSEFLAREKDISTEAAERMIRRHIGICYDVCHFAVEFEDQKKSIEKIISKNISIGKIQISSAVRAVFNKLDNEKILQQLQQFHEPRYLHQTVVNDASGKLKKFRDLPDALFKKTPTGELRTHYHVPLFLEKFENLLTTQPDVLQVLEFVKEKNITKHLEVETYTWDVLPQKLKTDLASNIIRELQWVKKNLET